MSSFKYEKFTGKALLDKIKTLSHLTHSERAKECGYYSIVYLEDGRRKTKLDIEEFYNAILEAKRQEKESQVNSNVHYQLPQQEYLSQPRKFDAVIGDAISPPVTGIVLGGFDGVKHRLESKSLKSRVAALSEALNYGEAGLDLVIGALKDSSKIVQSYACKLLWGRKEPKVKQALLNTEAWQFFTTLKNHKLENFNSKNGISDTSETAYVVNCKQFQLLLQHPKVKKLQALVCQMSPDYMEDEDEDVGFWSIVDDLFDACENLSNLKVLRIENYENSLGDISAILKVYPQLKALEVCGDGGLDFSPIQHESLKTLVINSSGLNNQIISQIGRLKLPALEYLDLSCGHDYYAYQANINFLVPIISGELFPKLRYLGIRGSKNYDKLAQAIARSSLVNRLVALDLSNGTMKDKGAEALLNCPAVNRLHTLNVSRNNLTSQMVRRLAGLRCRVIADSQHYYRYSPTWE